MTQALAAPLPAERRETTSMTIWPSLAVYASGRFLGRLYSIRFPDIYIFRLGNLLALASIPYALALYFYRVLPRVGVRYRLTDQRIMIERGGLGGTVERAVALDGFDTIDIAVQPGQEWFHAGDLVFRRSGTEVFRLGAVSRPETFRQTCLKARAAYVGVREVLARQAP